ncbi:hypothetical protein ACFQ88_08530 [Paenibacillus sp. NPDC056579]|uniref:hypothetical protein n=1 Tax=Paenibacillus sp. NPDC056579 TaxID=3345871 RepID=UPI0036AA6993
MAEISNNPGEVLAGHLRPTAALSKNLEKADALYTNLKQLRGAAFCNETEYNMEYRCCQ